VISRARARATIGGVSRFVAWVRRLVAPFLERLIELEMFDRAVAIASQAFVALIPYMVVVSTVLPAYERKDFADSIIHRFDLEGSSAAAIQQVFAAPSEVESTLSAFGVLLLVISALSFCRAMQRLYEKAWRIQARGMRSSGSHLIWLAAAALYASIGTSLNTAAADWLGPTPRVVLAFVLSYLLWLWTPYLLLGRRVERRSLRWTAVLTATGMTLFSIASLVYMPHSIAASAERYGMIGIAIAIVSWLVGVGFVLVVSAAFGAVLADRSAVIHPGPPGRRRRRALQRQTQEAEGQL
jgi:membrane protein